MRNKQCVTGGGGGGGSSYILLQACSTAGANFRATPKFACLRTYARDGLINAKGNAHEATECVQQVSEFLHEGKMGVLHNMRTVEGPKEVSFLSTLRTLFTSAEAM